MKQSQKLPALLLTLSLILGHSGSAYADPYTLMGENKGENHDVRLGAYAQ